MISLLNPRSWTGYLILAAFLATSLGCSYKPAYLKKGEKANLSGRWKVKAIDPSGLSPDEAAVFEKMGAPQYIRFYRQLHPDRQGVYAWVYTEPARFISFRDGKQVDYVVVDDDLSPLNEYQRAWRFWGGVTAGTAAGLALLYYLIVGSK